MRSIVLFLLLLAALFAASLAATSLKSSVPLGPDARLVIQCALIGGLAGCAYCLRAVYLNASVRKEWDDAWRPWYYIRPFVSTIFGGISYVFLRAGLLVLDAEHAAGSSNLGFLALAFIAGLNVDRFMERIEQIASSIWGIRPSRTSQDKES